MEYILTTITMDNFVKGLQHMNECKKMFPKSKCVPYQPVNICTVTAVPVTATMDHIWWSNSPKQQEGINPMRSYNDTYASASISNPKTDVATQRDYLLNQLTSATYPKDAELQKTFNLHVDNTPNTYKDMIDAIKNDKFTIDPKVAATIDATDVENRFFGPMYGIVWAGPQPDRDGYNAAREEAKKQKTIAERIIVTGDAAAGLAALEAFEAWQPTVATTTAN